MNIRRFYSIACLALLLSLHSIAQEVTKPFVKVSGEVAKPLSLYTEDLAGMKRSTVVMKDKDGKDHTYTGVAVQDILGMAGVSTGDQLRGKNLSKYVLAKCADGYEVLFSLAELDSTLTNRVVILADELEGKPLPAARGPFRLVVPGEKKPARSCFQLTELIIRFAK